MTAPIVGDWTATCIDDPDPLLEDKVAILSGVGEGFGRDTALLFAKHGAKLVITARRPDIIERVVAEVHEAADARGVPYEPPHSR